MHSKLTIQLVITVLLALVNLVHGQEKPEPVKPEAKSPQDAVGAFQVSADLEVELVLSEPNITQPVFFNFDERGRMWVMNYRQYPYPAGLKMVSRDRFWRVVYDKVPVAPPNHVRGADQITIHEDTDGDGVFDTQKIFVDGLNIATSFARGRGGVFVLNPPYLLYYPDVDQDDVPDGDPEVLLEGFGIQDTHSCANSLRWGPDGWLYACQGSTVTGNIRKPGEERVIHSLGQLVWRYHPERRIYEIFAEGGGNAFGLEFDAKGRVYSGHNGGDTRGFHYVQGGYYQKGFAKHGPLSNPFAFGYFPMMKHEQVSRFVHNFVIYQSDHLPEKYHGNLFGVEPLQGQLVRSKISPDGSSFKTTDIERPVQTKDVWFRPVDIKTGPDGAIYFADFYEPLISHRDHYAGNIDKSNGRIYRLKAKDKALSAPTDLSELTSRQLVERLRSPNKWQRQTVLRLIYDRRDPAILDELRALLLDADPQVALEARWALHAYVDQVNDSLLGLNHPDPLVQAWSIRLSTEVVDSTVGMNDQKKDRLVDTLAQIGRTTTNAHVASQLASSAKRLPPAARLPVLFSLLDQAAAGDFVSDIHIPLLIWWALEAQCTEAPELLLEALADSPEVFQTAMFQQHITEKLMRRFAQSGKREDLKYCARLLNLPVNDATRKQLIAGFEQAFRGRSVARLPDELTESLGKWGGGSLAFRMRRKDHDALLKAYEVVADKNADLQTRIEIVETLGQINEESCIPILKSAIQLEYPGFQAAVLTAMQAFDDPELAKSILEQYPDFAPEEQAIAQSVLSSRKTWSALWLEEVEKQQFDADAIPLEIVRKLTIHDDPVIKELVSKHWPNLEGISSEQMVATVARVQAALAVVDRPESDAKMKTDPIHGRQLFQLHCGKCHLMFGEGEFIGPDLTTYNRTDLNHMLANIVNPSAEIREGFENFKVLTLDGQLLTGFIADEDNQVIVIRGADGQSVTVSKDDIEDMSAQKKSLMPDGLLDKLTDQELRDLFAFLRSSQPLNVQ